MKTIDFSYFIERYIAGEMDEAERKWFEKELEGNSGLQVELKLRKRADAGLIRHDIIDLRNKLSAIEKERREKVASTSMKRATGFRFAAAIAAFMIMGGLYLLSTGHQSNESLYRKNFQPYPYSGISRSAEINHSEFNGGLKLYNNSDYAGAAILLKKYVNTKPEAMEAILLYGVSEMELGNFNEAKSSFRSILRNSDNLYLDIAQWYLALCYVKTNDKSDAVASLESIISSNSIYRDKARKLAKKIR